MIVIYPMLVSPNVSPNVLPGLIKSVEKYILVYNMDDILRSIKGRAGSIISTGADIAKVGVALMASKDNSDPTKLTISEASPQDIRDKIKQSAQKAQAITKDRKQTVQKTSVRGGTSSIDIPRSDAISLEPTWVQVTTSVTGLQILGVKVIPFTIKNTDNVIDMITTDQQRKGIQFKLTKYGRMAGRVFLRVLRKLKFPNIHDKTISGNIKMDVLFAGTKHAKNLFICLSQLDLEDNQDFLDQSKPQIIQKLHKLGWPSMIIADDVTKKATFCMQQFNGLCSAVPYSFMFSSLGRDHNKAYEDLEDLKRASGPFFNMRTNVKKIMTDSERIDNLNSKLDIIQG
jgi:hypothetical protein